MKKRTVVEVVVGIVLLAGVIIASTFAANFADEASGERESGNVKACYWSRYMFHSGYYSGAGLDFDADEFFSEAIDYCLGPDEHYKEFDRDYKGVFGGGI